MINNCLLETNIQLNHKFPANLYHLYQQSNTFASHCTLKLKKAA